MGEAWSSKTWTWLVVVIVAIIALVVLITTSGFNTKILNAVASSAAFFRSKSLQACCTYVLIYVVVSLICIPLTPFEVLTGFFFGVPFGIGIDLCGRLLGAVIAFSAARKLSQCGVENFVSGQAVLRGVGRAVEEHGLRFLILFNLAYVPVAVKNYGLGFVPEVPLSKFALAILIIEVPMASIWACIGSAAATELAASGGSLTDPDAVQKAIFGGEGGPVKIIILIVGIGSICMVLRLVHHKVSAELERVQPPLISGSGEAAEAC